MVSGFAATGFTSFVCGLVFLALAGIAHGASRKNAARQTWTWLVLAAAAYGFSQWTGVWEWQVGQSQACQLVRLAFGAASLVALIEFAEQALSDRRPGLLGRWTYLPCAVFAAVSLIGGGLNWLGPACQLAL